MNNMNIPGSLRAANRGIPWEEIEVQNDPGKLSRQLTPPTTSPGAAGPSNSIKWAPNIPSPIQATTSLGAAPPVAPVAPAPIIEPEAVAPKPNRITNLRASVNQLGTAAGDAYKFATTGQSPGSAPIPPKPGFAPVHVAEEAGRVERAMNAAKNLKGLAGELAPSGAGMARGALGVAAKAAPVVGAGMAGMDVANVAMNPFNTKMDVATQVAEEAGKFSTAGLGAAAGGAMGLAGGPLAPLTVPLGAMVGGAAGYIGGEQAIRGLRKLRGINPDSPLVQGNAAEAAALKPAQVVPKQPVNPIVQTQAQPPEPQPRNDPAPRPSLRAPAAQAKNDNPYHVFVDELVQNKRNAIKLAHERNMEIHTAPARFAQAQAHQFQQVMSAAQKSGADPVTLAASSGVNMDVIKRIQEHQASQQSLESARDGGARESLSKNFSRVNSKDEREIDPAAGAEAYTDALNGNPDYARMTPAQRVAAVPEITALARATQAARGTQNQGIVKGTLGLWRDSPVAPLDAETLRTGTFADRGAGLSTLFSRGEHMGDRIFKDANGKEIRNFGSSLRDDDLAMLMRRQDKLRKETRHQRK